MVKRHRELNQPLKMPPQGCRNGSRPPDFFESFMRPEEVPRVKERHPALKICLQASQTILALVWSAFKSYIPYQISTELFKKLYF